MSKIFMNRRHFLRNAGIASLAFSPLITSSRALADTGVKPRLLFIFLPHGPGGPGGGKGTEHNFTFSPWLSPLSAIKEHVTLVDGLFGTWWGNAHNVSYAHLLTGSANPNGGPPRNPSVDVMLEKKLGKGVLPVQRLVARASGYAGGRQVCYGDNLKAISLQTASQAQAAILNNIGGVQSSEAKLRALREKRKKILDEVAGELKTLRSRLTSEEKIKFDQFTNSINETASSLGLNGTIKTGGNCQKPGAIPSTKGLSRNKVYELGIDTQFANLKTTFACNLTQFGVLSFNEIPHDIYDWTDSSGKTRRGKPCGSTENFHQCVAHYKDKDGRLCFEGSVKWFMQKIANFAKELDAIKEPNGHTLLENTIIVISG
ncbi:MAG TPA: hypothetical protein DCE42_05870, partial [Myxococcales bacterium]|nr:hypothetical protein [Myxococcales bacterium]